MPETERLYIITDEAELAQAEEDAEAVDIAGVGTGSFAEGARLSNDGGDTVTHRAANVLRNGGILDLAEAAARFGSGQYTVYGSTARIGEGRVWFWDGSEYSREVGEGRLSDLALADAGLSKVDPELAT